MSGFIITGLNLMKKLKHEGANKEENHTEWHKTGNLHTFSRILFEKQ